MNSNQFLRGFIVFAAVLLFSTAAMKFYDVFFNINPQLLKADPVITFLQQKHLYLLVALIELAVVFFCCSRQSIWSKCLVILCLSNCFVIYRLSLLLMNKTHCSCAGMWAQSNSLVQQASLASLIVLLIGSAFGVLLPVLRSHKVIPRESEAMV